jgi:hypothetical protein
VWTHDTLGAIAKAKSNTQVTLDPESLPPGEHTLTVSAYSPHDFALSNPLAEQAVPVSITAPIDPQTCRRFIRPNGKNAYALVSGVSCYFNGDYLYVIDLQQRFAHKGQYFTYQEQAPDYYSTRYELIRSFWSIGKVILRGSTSSTPGSRIELRLFKSTRSPIGFYIRTSFPLP